MAEAKTKATNQSVEKFIKSQPNQETRADCYALMKLMKEASGADPQMWGTSIVGFGTNH